MDLKQLKVKLYCDGADKKSMLDLYKNPLVKGFTTNPSLMRKAGINDYKAFCKDILETIKDRPISFEVFADDFAEMARQGREIATWGKNVYVKIPVTNSEGQSSLPLIKTLSHEGISLNVTALFTPQQVLGTCEALKGGAPSVVSVFAGRVADTGRDPMPLMYAAREMCAIDPNMELLWASTREVYNIFQADQAGSHIITVPFDILNKLNGVGKDLTQMSLDTVKTFKKDSIDAGFKL
jgi:transaldolase